jgi:Cache domain.
VRGGTPEECALAVVSILEPVFERVESWRVRVAEHVVQAHGVVARADIDALIADLAVPELTREPSVTVGAGFVAAPGFLTDAPWHLAWWLGTRNTFGVGAEEPSVRRLEAVEDPTSESFRDYTGLEWWRVPTSTGAPHITGPYVDYLCTDDYTLTLTVPVTFGDELIGVVGADIYVRTIERILLPALRTIPTLATLVNSSGRVIVSTDAHRPTGSLYRVEALTARLAALRPGTPTLLPGGEELIGCGRTGLALVIETRV